ncbi:MAG: response regulator transcription factor [Anaerolineae bacterium]|nr:response regulator transcription factor [Anaerolineae bacterium]
MVIQYQEGMALIIYGSEPLREGLIALLTAIPQIKEITTASNIQEAEKIVQRQLPVLAFLLPPSSEKNLQISAQKIKSKSPKTKCIALIDDEKQMNILLEAGVDCVKPKGFPANELFLVIQKLLALQ